MDAHQSFYPSLRPTLPLRETGMIVGSSCPPTDTSHPRFWRWLTVKTSAKRPSLLSRSLFPAGRRSAAAVYRPTFKIVSAIRKPNLFSAAINFSFFPNYSCFFYLLSSSSTTVLVNIRFFGTPRATPPSLNIVDISILLILIIRILPMVKRSYFIE